jgi:phosphatidylserine/phosphatidylglycerophosphate/cardiolipin synthase-like enzyme
MTSPTTDSSASVDLGTLVVTGGFFVYRLDAPHRTPFVPTAGASQPYRHSLTYSGGGSTSRADVLELIDSARRKVFVASYFIGDAEVREALCRAAERLRGGVYVISAMTDRDLKRAINEVGEHRQVDEKIERKRFEELTKHGIAVRAYEGCHAKFAVVDDRVALVSSANLTTDGLDTTGENGVVVDAPAVAEVIARFFAVLWHGSSWEMAMTGEPDVGERTVSGPPVRLPAPEPDAVGPIWTLGDQQYIREAIASLIRSAHNELLLATYSLEGMTRHPDLLLDPVRDAVERGVEVRLLLRGRNHIASHTADAAALAALGVQLYPCRRNHAKGVIADRERGALFSANFDASHGLDRDVELGMRLDGTPALAEAHRYFEHAIAERDLDYVRDPAAHVLAARVHSYELTPWPLPDEIGLIVEDADWAFLCDLTQGPVLFTGRPEDDLRIYASRRAWRVTPDEPARLMRVAGSQPMTAADRLATWLTAKRGEKARAPRGICAARFHRVPE